MVIYANAHHNSAEEVQLTPIEGSRIAKYFMELIPPHYISEVVDFHTNEHWRDLGWQLVLRPPASATAGCLLSAVSKSSITDPLNQKALE